MKRHPDDSWGEAYMLNEYNGEMRGGWRGWTTETGVQSKLSLIIELKQLSAGGSGVLFV